ncbi:ABC transporter ATP-binding protein [Paenibacillus cymbidii]|uniref:ABC transporter ATP-binding protein n=1 Tax=Paenibacillus cymbidii TaxID=1639034 RepID=UPI001081C2C5|nr:ABC transporter ATP-binding protein [Paenibacillus cymbidii]
MGETTARSSIWSPAWRLHTYTSRSFWRWGIWRWFGGLASASLNIMIARTLGKMLDIAISGIWSEAVTFMIWMAIFVLARTGIHYINILTNYRYRSEAAYLMQHAIIDKINALPIGYFESRHTGTVTSRLLNDIEKIQQFLTNSVAGIWSHTPVNILFGLSLLFFINWKLTLIVITVVMVTTFLLSKVSIPLSSHAKAEQASMTKYNAYLRDFLEGNEIYKIFGMEKTHGKRYNAAVAEQYGHNKAIRKRRSFMGAISGLNFFLPFVLSYVVGSFFVASGEITIGSLYAFSMILPNVTLVAYQVEESVALIVESSGISRHFFGLIDTPEERRDGADYSLADARCVIAFDKVGYSYPNGLHVLDNCSFSVPKAAMVALVGASGGGKSTLFKLLSGYYEAYSGEIRINGHSLREWNLRALRSNIAYVGQESYLFDNTIMENIRHGRPGATDDEVIAAAKAAYADEFIQEIEHGYQATLGERGINLSGGQRQRITIARAILRNAPIILLDEPTAALDTRSEFHVQQALNNLSANKTLFVIAHRISTIQHADLILVLDNGTIVEQGTHQELVARSGRYVALYSTQIVEEKAYEA